jgi:hypothetical protein
MTVEINAIADRSVSAAQSPKGHWRSFVPPGFTSSTKTTVYKSYHALGKVPRSHSDQAYQVANDDRPFAMATWSAFS